MLVNRALGEELDWTMSNDYGQQQRDGYSCGIMAINNGFQVATGVKETILNTVCLMSHCLIIPNNCRKINSMRTAGNCSILLIKKLKHEERSMYVFGFDFVHWHL